MPEKSSEKQEAIRREIEETIRNYSVIREDVLKVTGKLHNMVGQIDENVDRLGKANRIYKSLPEELFSKPSPVLDSLIASGSELAGGVYAHSEYFKGSIQRIRDESDSLIVTTAVVDASFNTTSNVLISIAKIAVLQDPKIGELIEVLELPSPFGKRKELESDLRKIKERLADMYEGAWQTLRDKSKLDRYRQAAHSMRDVITNLLNLLAPHKEVKRAEWYEQISGTNSVTRPQRVKYAIIGGNPEKTIDEKDLEEINNLAKDTNDVYQDFSKFHSIDAEGEILIESYMDRSVSVICLILKLRKRLYISPQ